jgi:hypothetical protein
MTASSPRKIRRLGVSTRTEADRQSRSVTTLPMLRRSRITPERRIFAQGSSSDFEAPNAQIAQIGFIQRSPQDF